jgi:hypothetical protein
MDGLKARGKAVPSFGADEIDDGEEVVFTRPKAGVAAAESDARRQAAVDLTDTPKIVLAVGRGKTGKTTLLRWMAEQALAAKREVRFGDLDPTNASFASYFEGVHQPSDDDPKVRARFLEKFLLHHVKQRASTLIDLGGADTTLRQLLTSLPGLDAAMEADGVSLVLLYLLGPDVDDLAPLAALEELRFAPKATALVRNTAAVEPGFTREESFARATRYGVYRRAVERGAVQLWLPNLLPAREIEARRLTFAQARDGEVRDGSKHGSLSLTDRLRVRAWLEAMDAEMGPIQSWMP